MRLLYCYIGFMDKNGEAKPYRGLDQVELNFSTVNRFEFDSMTNTLRRRGRQHPLPGHFWDVASTKDAPENGISEHSNIYNVNVLSGENGSGKTTAMHCLIDMLDGLHAAVDPAVSNRGRMEELGVATNRALLLFEEDGITYLLHYMPHALQRMEESPDHSQSSAEEERTGADNPPEPQGLQLEGFALNLKRYEVSNWQELAESQTETGRMIAKLLRKTKIVYLTNTLNQHDYERHIGERNQRLRDFFVYDASIGSTIGPDIAQFFPYEVYKQVRFVFDKNQAAKQNALKEELQILRLPDVLRLHLRIELEEQVFPQEESSTADDRESTTEKEADHREDNLSSKLGRLCIAAYAKNLRMYSDVNFRPMRKSMSKRIHPSTLDAYKAQLKDVEKGYLLEMGLFLLKGHKRPVTSVCFSPDGRLLASGSDDGTMRLWDTHTGEQATKMTGHRGRVTSVCFSPNGHLVASGAHDSCVRLWNTRTGEQATKMTGHGDQVASVCFSPDGRFLASGSGDGTMRLWDMRTGERVSKMAGRGSGVYSVCFSPDGRLVASGSDDGIVRLWDAITVELVAEMASRGSGVYSVCFSPDGRLVASGSSDGSVHLWDARTGKPAAEMAGHRERVTSVCFSPDGRLVASGSSDGSVHLWDAHTGKQVVEMTGNGGPVNSVCFSPDGRLVASGSDDGAVRLWDAHTVTQEASESDAHTVRLWNIKPIKHRQAALDFAEQHGQDCTKYIDFLFAKDESLFSRFRCIDDRTYELSLDELHETTLGQDAGDPEESGSLYTDLVDFIEKYRATCRPTYTIDFDWGLSSGEENMLRIFSNLYHIFDRDDNSSKHDDYRVYNNEGHADDNAQKTVCDTVLLFMDEADLTLHPEWQRRLINVLATFIPQIYPPSGTKDIQLILSTHSPLILGDIPSENIAYLPPKKDRSAHADKAPKEETDPDNTQAKPDQPSPWPIPEETFGQNIHTILKESFFLENGTVGDFAGKKINGIARRLKVIAAHGASELEHNPSLNDELEQIRQTIQIVAPGVLRTKLKLLYRDAEAAVGMRKAVGPTPNARQLLNISHELSQDEQRWLLAQLLRESEDHD